MKRILLTIIVGMFLLTCVSATDFLGQQFEEINIIENCRDDGAPCDATYLCNITITDPFNNINVSNAPMTRNDTFYNYTLTATGELGVYHYTTDCSNATFAGTNKGLITVTTTGKTPNMMITLLLLGVALVLFIIALIIKNKSIGFIAGILFVIAGTYTMIYGFGDLADLYTRSIALSTLGFGLFLILSSGWEWMNDL